MPLIEVKSCGWGNKSTEKHNIFLIYQCNIRNLVMYSVASKSVLTKGVVTPLASMELTLLPGVVPLATVIVCFGKID
ncbi:hypothetical protein [Enterobacter roggenkampii]|jgi:hypothetical protein|uniref:hypothetical protein n=1 Tax=Enterobacter roggenkampii TaxID=1812935 RepID=UPI0010423717|nr:hypothetical protein [Enterobacter roggenkampii]